MTDPADYLEGPHGLLDHLRRYTWYEPPGPYIRLTADDRPIWHIRDERTRGEILFTIDTRGEAAKEK
jgi:hypothetical protein